MMPGFNQKAISIFHQRVDFVELPNGVDNNLNPVQEWKIDNQNTSNEVELYFVRVTINILILCNLN